jgi:hypothetical protein
MSLTPDTVSMTYELTLAGVLGPAVRTVLQPIVSASAELHTIVRAGSSSDLDLVDLVRILDSMGVEITEIAAVSA